MSDFFMSRPFQVQLIQDLSERIQNNVDAARQKYKIDISEASDSTRLTSYSHVVFWYVIYFFDVRWRAFSLVHDGCRSCANQHCLLIFLSFTRILVTFFQVQWLIKMYLRIRLKKIERYGQNPVQITKLNFLEFVVPFRF